MYATLSCITALTSTAEMLEPYGPNIASTEGDLWKFHSRIASPTFDEYTQKLVWEESTRRTEGLVSLWSKDKDYGWEKGMYSLTMEVMVTVSFGQQPDWNADEAEKPRSRPHELSFLGALRGVVMHLPQILIIPKALLRRSPWKFAHTSYFELDRHMNELLVQGTKNLDMGLENSRTNENLLKAILRSNRENEEKSPRNLTGKAGLTNQEIKGNLFIFLLAGLCFVTDSQA
jgi:hypothetical protein